MVSVMHFMLQAGDIEERHLKFVIIRMMVNLMTLEMGVVMA